MCDLPRSASAISENREKQNKKTLENINVSFSVSQVIRKHGWSLLLLPNNTIELLGFLDFIHHPIF
jgi:hypothetical protein